MGKQQQRREVRRTLALYLNCTAENHDLRDAKIADISQSGMLILTQTELKTGTKLEISITVPALRNSEPGLLRVQGSIVWSNVMPNRDLCLSGLQFSHIGEHEKQEIQRIIDHIGFSNGERKLMETDNGIVYR